MALDENVNTEGKFEFRIKPKIDHGNHFLNRAIEELQQIIVANKESANDFLTRFKTLEQDIVNIKQHLDEIKKNG